MHIPQHIINECFKDEKKIIDVFNRFKNGKRGIILTKKY